SGQRGDKPAEQELPPIVRADGSNNGFWVHSRQLVWMNEDTAKSKDLVERRSFDDILARRLDAPVRPDGAAALEDKKSLNEKKAEGRTAEKPNGNRLTYLDEPCNPWYVHRDFPKLTTPMWVGEEGVEAVV